MSCRQVQKLCTCVGQGLQIMQPLFRPFRALGYISDDVPFAVQRRGKETFVTLGVGKAWQASCACFSIISVLLLTFV